MNKQLLFAIAGMALILPMISAHAQEVSTTGNLNVAGTCGISFVAGAPINYGSLTPSQESAEQLLTIDNTGTVPATLMVQGSDWEDATLIPQMLVSETHFGTTVASPYNPPMPTPPGPGMKSALDHPYLPITNTFDPITNLDTYWQVAVNLLNPSFVGSLTQEMNFTTTC